MSKILLVDDSLTIQKVIKLTFANGPYEIIECSDRDKIEDSIREHSPVLVLLDYNISDSQSGYEICKEIKDLDQSLKVIILFGPFDSVDDAELLSAGAAEKVIKPFDGTEFIQLCNKVIESNEQIEVESDQTIDFKEEEQWEVNTPAVNEEIELSSHLPSPMPDLENKIAEWSVEVPGVISEEGDSSQIQNLHAELPPVILESESLLNDEASEVSRAPSISVDEDFEAKIPSVDDLEYPSLTDSSSGEIDIPGLTPLSDLIGVEDAVDIGDEKTKEMHFEPLSQELLNSPSITNLKDQISEEISEDLWKADEFYDEDESGQLVKEQIEASQVLLTSEEKSDDVHETKINSFEQLGHISLSQSEVHEIIDQKVKEKIDDVVKKYLEVYVSQSLEKVAWEMMPDLAENLIKEELNKISDQVLNEE